MGFLASNLKFFYSSLISRKKPTFSPSFPTRERQKFFIFFTGLPIVNDRLFVVVFFPLSINFIFHVFVRLFPFLLTSFFALLPVEKSRFLIRFPNGRGQGYKKSPCCDFVSFEFLLFFHVPTIFKKFFYLLF